VITEKLLLLVPYHLLPTTPPTSTFRAAHDLRPCRRRAFANIYRILSVRTPWF